MRPHVSVLVVDDDAVVRAWVRLSLEGTEFFVAGEAATAAEGRALADRRLPKVLLVDLNLGEKGSASGVDLVRDVRAHGIPSSAVVMTARPEPGLNELAEAAGAQGTVLKRGRTDDLLEVLRAVVGGDTAFDPDHPRAPAPNGRQLLSNREREVLSLVAAGATNSEIASDLGIGEETVKTLLARAYAKLGVRRRAQAVAAAHERGLL